MSKSTRAHCSGATNPTAATTTTLRASARPLTATPSDFPPEPGDLPAHTAPFKAFDWLDGADHIDPATRDLVNDTINVCTGVALVLRIIEQCEMVGDFSPEEVTLADGSAVEQPEAPYLSVSECAALHSLAAASISLLTDRVHQIADTMRRTG